MRKDSISTKVEKLEVLVVYYQYYHRHIDFVVQLSSFMRVALFIKFVASSYDTSGYISQLGRLLQATLEKCYNDA
jgi:hypothetical protein